MNQPDVQRLHAVVRALATESYAGRRVGTGGGAAAARYLTGVLVGLGAAVSSQEFGIAGVVRELYGIPKLTWTAGSSHRELEFRREFCEQLASADRATPTEGVLASSGDVTGAWVLQDSFAHDAVASAAAAGAVGVIVPRGTDAAGWMPKMIAGPTTAAIPVLAVRTDHCHELRDRVSGGVDISATMPLRSVDVVGQNLVATFRRGDEGAPSFLLTAHYDGVGDDPGGVRFPAACDNASGVASVIEAARILQDLLPPELGLEVALLDGEEAGAYGSAAHASTVVPGTQVINLDGAAALSVAHVEGGGDAEQLLRALDASGRELGVPLAARAMPSDNRRYAAAGLAAIGIGMGTPGYQTPSETPDQVQTETLVAATRLLVETVLRLATRRAAA